MSAERPTARPVLAAVAAVIVMASLGTLYAWSVFVEPLEAELQTSRSTVSAVFSVAIVAFTVGMLVGPLLYRHLSAVVFILLTGILAGAGLALAAAGGGFWIIACGYGGLFGIANGFGYGIALQFVHNVLPHRRGIMTGVVVASYTAGSALAAPILDRIIGTSGTGAAFLALAAALMVANAVAALLARLSQAALHQRTTPAAAPDLPGRRRQFVLLWLSFLLISAIGVMTLGHAAPLAGSLGGSGWQLSLAVMLTTVGNGIGRLAGGWLCELVPPRSLLAGAPAIIGAALIAVLAAGNVTGVHVGLFVVGIGYGSVAAALPMIIARSYGGANVTRVYGRMFTAWGVSGLLAPFIGGLLFDTTGNYDGALIGAAAMALAAVLLGLCYREA